MLNFIKKIYLFIAKIFIIILGGLGVILGLYYPLSLLMGTDTVVPYLIGGIGGIVYAIGLFVKLVDGDFS